MKESWVLNHFKTKRRVEFSDTDAAGIAHFSAFFRYMEQAEHELLRSVGLTVFAPQPAGGHLSWPRVRVECDYQGAAKFEDMLDVLVSVEKLGAKSVRYCFQFLRGETKIASGQVVAVCCHVRHEQPLESVEIPAHIREKLSTYATSQS